MNVKGVETWLIWSRTNIFLISFRNIVNTHLLETNLNWTLIYFAERFFAFAQLSFDLIPFLAIWCKQRYTWWRQTKRKIKSATQKTKKVSNTGPTKKQRTGVLMQQVNRRLWIVSKYITGQGPPTLTLPNKLLQSKACSKLGNLETQCTHRH